MSIGFMLSHPDLIASGVAMSGQLLDDVKSFAVQPQDQRKSFFLGYGSKEPLITPDDMRKAN